MGSVSREIAALSVRKTVQTTAVDVTVLLDTSVIEQFKRRYGEDWKERIELALRASTLN